MKVSVVSHSLFGHVNRMAMAAAEDARSVASALAVTRDGVLKSLVR